MRTHLIASTSLVGLFALAGTASAVITPFDFQGNAGFGLLPGNEIGTNTPVGQGVTSPAIGGEIGDGLYFDSDTSTLEFSFEFSGLTGGLFDAATGIHFHITNPGADPFNETGGIALNLNSGTDPAVTNDTPLLATDGSVSSGVVTGRAVLNATQIEQLFDGRFYLNIHSGQFTGGELRGNLVVVPAPAGAALLGLAGLIGVRRRR